MISNAMIVWLLIVSHPNGVTIEYRAPSREICEFVAERNYPNQTVKGRCVKSMGLLAPI